MPPSLRTFVASAFRAACHDEYVECILRIVCTLRMGEPAAAVEAYEHMLPDYAP